jgi:hypothetical protein
MVDGRVFVSWCVRALSLLSRVQEHPHGLRSILERVAGISEFQVEVSASPRRLRDKYLPGMTDADWCLPDTMVMVQIPEIEGLAEYARGAGLQRGAVGVPRAALRLHDE